MMLASLARAVFEADGAPERLIILPTDRPIVFVGDTHGDREATDRLFDRFPLPDHVLVFLGDTIDRGPDSRGNLERILTEMANDPSSVRLLMGNHEAWATDPFTPADFWLGLGEDEERELAAALSRLPFAAHHASGLLALHGALPELEGWPAIGGIELGSQAWRAIAWGDWEAGGSGGKPVAGWRRPTFDRADFEQRASRLGIRVLVRSHQPSAPRYLFDDRCLTLFTSAAYGDGRRRVARLRTGIELQSARDLEIIEL